MYNETTVRIAERVRQIRADYKMTQQQFAEALCITEGRYAELERGNMEFPDFLCAAIAIKFKARKKWIMSGTGIPYLELPERQYPKPEKEDGPSILKKYQDEFLKIYGFLQDIEKEFHSIKKHVLDEYIMAVSLHDTLDNLCSFFLPEENPPGLYPRFSAFKLPLLTPEEMAELELALGKHEGSRHLMEKISSGSLLFHTFGRKTEDDEGQAI